MHRTYVTAHSLPGKHTNHPINNGYYNTASVLDVITEKSVKLNLSSGCSHTKHVQTNYLACVHLVWLVWFGVKAVN